MGDRTMTESSTILFNGGFEDLHDDGFEGSTDEQRIFNEILLGSDISRKEEFIVPQATAMHCDYIKETDVSLSSNSGKSSLSSQDDKSKEDFTGKLPLECLPVDPTLSAKDNHDMKLPVGNLPGVKPDLGDTLFTSEGVISDLSQENSSSACNSLTYYIVESSGSVAKYRKISRSERSCLESRPVQDWGDDGTNQGDFGLFDVPISSGAPQPLDGSETVLVCQNCRTSSPSFDQIKEEESAFGHIRKGHEKSRKISEVAGTHSGERSHFPVDEMDNARFGSKKSKACRLNDDDLLISAIMKNKTCRGTHPCKWSNRKSKPRRRRKTPKGSCKFLPRSLKKDVEGKWSLVGPRTMLSWLIYSGVISVNEESSTGIQKTTPLQTRV